MSRPSQKPGTAMKTMETTPATASGHPLGRRGGRMRSTTKMIIDTPMRVPRAKRARRARYFFTGGGGGPGGPPPKYLALHPDLIPADHVVDAEVRRRVLAAHLVVPGVVDLFVRD